MSDIVKGICKEKVPACLWHANRNMDMLCLPSPLLKELFGLKHSDVQL